MSLGADTFSIEVNGETYIDSTLSLNVQEMKIRDCEIVIPNISKHCQFLFQKESSFVEIDSGASDSLHEA